MSHPSYWRDARVIVRNPSILRTNNTAASFRVVDTDPYSAGLRFIAPPLLKKIQEKQIREVVLVGPNINRFDLHFSRLAKEVPLLQHITFHCCPLDANAAQTIHNEFAHLRSVEFVQDFTFGRIMEWKRLETLTLTNCNEVRDRIINMIGCSLTGLRTLTLQRCVGYTKGGLESFRARFPTITLEVITTPATVRPPYQAAGVVRTCRCQPEQRKPCWSSAVSGRERCVCTLFPSSAAAYPSPARSLTTVDDGGITTSATTAAAAAATAAAVNVNRRLSNFNISKPSWAQPDEYVRMVHGESWDYLI